MKALYLKGLGGLEVGRDGPALRARRPGRADGQYPLQRVARVVVVGRVRWRPEALRACLREHKPVAILDARGRFVRVIFRTPPRQCGLARHLGELLRVPRFRARYERWYRMAEGTEMDTAARGIDVPREGMEPDHLWQALCREQHRRWRLRVGAYYRYLIGLATAQIASAFCLIGLPRDPKRWERQEYRLLEDMIRLERWRLAVLLERELARHGGGLGRRELTAAFESAADERERRIAAWRQRALLEMMCGKLGEKAIAGCEQPERRGRALQMSPAIARLTYSVQRCLVSNCGRIPFGAQDSLRTSVRIFRSYLEYDRRTYERYRKA